MISTLLLFFGTGIWSPGLESLEGNILSEYSISQPETQWEKTPFFSARSVLLIEEESMTPVFSYQSDISLPMASLTKMMTALIIIENHELDEIVTITKASEFTGGSTMHLKEQEQLTVESLLKGLLMRSGNDAAIALARYDSGTVYGFIKKMNKRAEALYLKKTLFNNPHGLDSENHYSSSHDLVILAKVLFQHQKIRKIVQTQEDTVFSLDNEEEHFLKNTNKLLGSIFPVYGIKTGTTENAGQCLLLYIRGKEKNYFLVILGSEDRYQDAKNILYRLLDL